jgi:hypothetical protein
MVACSSFIDESAEKKIFAAGFNKAVTSPLSKTTIENKIIPFIERAQL